MNIGGINLELAEKIREYLVKKKGEKGAGVSTAVVLEGELIAACSVGVRGTDGSPADIGDLYNIGSISKIYCVAAIMKLIELKKIKLDDPVVEYLPLFKMRDKRYTDITIHMLLNYSSGLPGCNYRNDTADRWIETNRMDENYEYFSHSKLKARPGLASTYCNDGFTLAAAIVEEVSDKPYIEFLREYITTPAGALTTGIGKVGINQRRIMSCLGKNPEWLSCVGSGAIRTDLSDCARFGYLFIDSGKVIEQKCLAEACKAQGASFLKYDSYSRNYGYGWDTVSFENWKVELGANTLAKSGGVAQFDSQLIVSPEYKISAAISATTDCELDLISLICDIITLVMEERGVDITKSLVNQNTLHIHAKPVPQHILDKNANIYYSAEDVYKLEILNNKLLVYHYDGDDNWEREWWLPEMEWDGNKFISDSFGLFFEEYSNKDYIILLRDGQYYDPLAQRNKTYPEINTAWQRRIGKKYMACNISAHDMDGISEAAVMIDRAEDEDVLLFIRPDDETTIPAVICGDNDTDMFIDIPLASTDLYSPFFFQIEGTEYLRICAYIYKNVETIPVLKTGKISSPVKEKNAIFKTKAGTMITLNKPDNVVVILFNEDLVMVYNSYDNSDIPELCDGYIIFANDGPMDFQIEVKKE